MEVLTSGLTLAADAAVDLQMHTTYSDGIWEPTQLVAYLVSEQFALVAVTDHDRLDATADIQYLGAQKGLPVLPAVEMTTKWRGKPVDLLCYNFGPDHQQLQVMCEQVIQRQRENVQAVYSALRRRAYQFPRQGEILRLSGGEPLQVRDMFLLLQEHGYGTIDLPVWRILVEAGLRQEMNDIASVVEAAQRAGGVCVLAHPGREDITCFNERMLDQFYQDVPVDGIEAYYPLHTPEQEALYLSYARRKNLLVSAGSDSHTPDRKPIKYRAELSRTLLERVGIKVAGPF
jgi:predicted metal-dependent phosphoesterase TrpH